MHSNIQSNKRTIKDQYLTATQCGEPDMVGLFAGAGEETWELKVSEILSISCLLLDIG